MDEAQQKLECLKCAGGSLPLAQQMFEWVAAAKKQTMLPAGSHVEVLVGGNSFRIALGPDQLSLEQACARLAEISLHHAGEGAL